MIHDTENLIINKCLGKLYLTVFDKKENMSKLLENTDYCELDDFLPISSENDLKMIENTLKWCRTFKFVLVSH